METKQWVGIGEKNDKQKKVSRDEKNEKDRKKSREMEKNLKSNEEKSIDS